MLVMLRGRWPELASPLFLCESLLPDWAALARGPVECGPQPGHTLCGSWLSAWLCHHVGSTFHVRRAGRPHMLEVGTAPRGWWEGTAGLTSWGISLFPPQLVLILSGALLV